MTEEIPDNELINESYSKNPYPLWIWIAVILAMTAIYWKSQDAYRKYVQQQFQESPFLHVTNRQLSLFLWQFPHYMRVQSRNKNDYLTGYQTVNRITPYVDQADEYVVAPPELLFLYHTWDRLIKNAYSQSQDQRQKQSQRQNQRPIPENEFLEFLRYDQQWLPDNWPGAPAEYTRLVKGLKEDSSRDLRLLSEGGGEGVLPIDVRIGFQGWRNFFKEGEQINSLMVTEEMLWEFLEGAPEYGRNYWENLFPDYLRSSGEGGVGVGVVPVDELEPFVKVAIFNFEISKISRNPKLTRDD